MGAGDPNAKPAGKGGTIHPDARAGGGGPGYFRDASPVIGDDVLQGTVRHAKSPANRLRLDETAGLPAGAGATAANKKNPPKTQTLERQIAAQSGPEMNIDVRVRVLADRKKDPGVPSKSGKTRVMPSSGLKNIAGMAWNTLDGKVTAVTKKLIVRGVYEIRTSYGSKASASQDSLYGRGTTTADKAAGTITLGFHEWCHQQEYLDYLLNTPFPTFAGRLKMKEDDFQAAVDQFNADFEAFSQGLADLGDAVDEVGYTKSECAADGKC